MISRLFLFITIAGVFLTSGMLSCSNIAQAPNPKPNVTTATSDTGTAEMTPTARSGDSGTGAGVNSTPSSPASFLPPANSKTVVQLTNNDDDDSWGGNNFWKTISRGKILWQRSLASGDIDIILGDTDGNQETLKTVSNADVDFMALGSGSGSDDILASWREDLAETFVSSGLAPTSLGKHNQEENTIADGCLFYRDSTAYPINDEIARYSAAEGNEIVSQASFDDSEPVTSACQAVWIRDGALVFFNGTSIDLVADAPVDGFDLRDGLIVYGRNGDVFVYDTTIPNAVAVNLTQNAADLNRSPKTDGRFVVFLRDVGGTGTHEVVLYDVVQDTFDVISTTNAPKDDLSLEIDLKQAIWKEGDDLYFYDGLSTILVDPTPAVSVNEPHLADGIVTWHGSTGPGTDEEIFLLK